MLTPSTVAELRCLTGKELGVSGWHGVTQERIDAFAELTGDRQWIHTDVDRARSGVFGATIAHGYYTLALAPMLTAELLSLQGFAFAVNYGLNRVRFPAPLPVGARVRLRLSVEAVSVRPTGTDLTLLLMFESDRDDKPVCVAESVMRIVEHYTSTSLLADVTETA
jgi:acyl dehydratase